MNAYLFPSIEFGPIILQRLYALLPEDQLDLSLEEGRFTPRQVIAHLADWEPIMRQRIATACTQPGATIEAYDEVAMAAERGYSLRDPIEQLEAFQRERGITAAYLRSLEGEVWSNTVRHPERGEQTTEDLANLLLGHDLYHIEQISAYFDNDPTPED
jgi:Mycothiol maleylpyruvate isomerase N-terminal domain.